MSIKKVFGESHNPLERLDGKKRKPKRTMKKLFKDARATLEERKGQGPKDPMKNWDESWVEYTQRIRKENREVLLNSLCPSRECSLCHKIKMNSRQWVILGKKAQEVLWPMIQCEVVCRVCYYKHYVNRSKNKGGRPKSR